MYLRAIPTNIQRLSLIAFNRSVPSALRALHAQRRFSSSPQRQAAPTTQEVNVFAEKFKDTDLFRELSAKPTVLQSAKDLIQVLHEEGFTFDSQNPPSVMKMAFNTRVREQLMRTTTIFKENGIDAAKLKDAYKIISGN